MLMNINDPLGLSPNYQQHAEATIYSEFFRYNRMEPFSID